MRDDLGWRIWAEKGSVERLDRGKGGREGGRVG